MRVILTISVLLGWLLAASVAASPNLSAPAPDGLRPGGSLADSHPAPLIAPPERESLAVPRAHPYLPPVVPHHVRDHQVDMNANRCLSCHDVERAQAMLAPPMSPTHYRDRDGKATGQVAGGRYFCLSCHVAQQQARSPVANEFVYPGRVHAPLDH